MLYNDRLETIDYSQSTNSAKMLKIRSNNPASNSTVTARKAKTVLVENNLSTASVPFRFFIQFAKGANIISLGSLEVTSISGRFVILKMKFID